MNILTHAQREEPDQQMSITPADANLEGVPGEHMKLIALDSILPPSSRLCGSGENYWMWVWKNGKNRMILLSHWMGDPYKTMSIMGGKETMVLEIRL
jgi:hypothetical protein